MTDDLFQDIKQRDNPKTYRYFNGVSWKTSSSGRCIPIHFPHDGSIIGYVQAVTREEIDDVIQRAARAQQEWRHVPLKEKMTMIKRAAQILRDYESFFTEMLIVEIGKSRYEAKSEVLRTADSIEFCTYEVINLYGYAIKSDVFPGYKEDIVSHVERVPHGVILAIGPFNYPLNLVASKVAPALLMGNAVVVKPPTQGSISGLMLTQAFVKAGIPKNIISCITGEGREIGDYLTTHPGISMIAFTGSSSVGQAMAQRVGMKPLLCECGGNNPVVVLPDADMSLTAKEIVRGGFAYAGQRCTGIKYVLAMKETRDRLLPLVLEYMNTMIHVGDPRDDATSLVGPVISEKAAEEIERVIQDAVSQGATIVSGGSRRGAYIDPTILTNVSNDMRVVKEETFGPIVSFIDIASIDEAIEIIASSAYGLQASVFSLHESAARRIADRLPVGTVQINGSPQRGPDHFPFMGIKASGLGVQGIRYSLEAMSRLKSVVVNPTE